MSELFPKHGGYRKLKSFQVAQLVYDITVRFVDRYIDRFSRTKDQMVQAARSGVQNIAEGSQASATSKKMELKLTRWHGQAWKICPHEITPNLPPTQYLCCWLLRVHFSTDRSNVWRRILKMRAVLRNDSTRCK